MALTLTDPTERPWTGKETWGRTRVVEKLVTFDSSYDAGGESLTAAMFGLTSLWDVKAQAKGGYSFEWSPTNASTGLLLARPQLTSVVETITKANATDVTTTGTRDFQTTIPAGSMIVGWRANTTGAWTGDTSAVLQIGVAGDLDRFTADTTSSVFATGIDGSTALAADAQDGISAAVTPRITITSAADFTNTSAGGSTTCELFYIPPGLPLADLSTLVTSVRVVAYGY